MTQSLIVLNSITYAYKAFKILEQLWIKSAVVKTPGKYSAKGCGYSLIIYEKLEEAIEALNNEGIRILNIIPDYRP